MIALVFALFGQVVADTTAPVVDRVVLKEDYQVLQRDSHDRASCVAVLPKEFTGFAAFFVTVEDGTGKMLRQVESTPTDLGKAEKGVSIDDLEVGGPYAITISAKKETPSPQLKFRSILVGDIWILGGQSNMFGIDLIKEECVQRKYAVAAETKFILVNQIEPLIHEIRGQKVMLDSDLAKLYDVETNALNRAVKRNPERFPSEFMFQLTQGEFGSLRYQFGTLKTGRGQHRKYQPYVFTEHGAFVAASVLNSPQAVEVSVFVVRAFVKLRQLVLAQTAATIWLSGFSRFWFLA